MRTPPENEKAALAPTSAALNTAHGGDFTLKLPVRLKKVVAFSSDGVVLVSFSESTGYFHPAAAGYGALLPEDDEVLAPGVSPVFQCAEFVLYATAVAGGLASIPVPTIEWEAPAEFTLTMFRCKPEKAKRVRKSLSLDEQGDLVKADVEGYWDGTAQRQDAVTLDKLCKYLSQPAPDSLACLTAGVNANKDMIMGATNHRSKENFPFPVNGAMFLVDTDEIATWPNLCTPEDVRLALARLGADADCVTSSSASSFLEWPNGKQKLRGLHTYYAIDRGSEIPRVLKVLHKRAWLAGYGRILVCENGTLRDRSIVDLALGTSNQSIFEFGAVINDSRITQDRQVTLHNGHRRQIIATDILDLTDAEEAEFQRLVAEAKAAAAPAAEKQTEAWLDKQIAAVPEDERQARREHMLALREVKRRDLPPDFLVTLNDESTVTVAEILAEPDKWSYKAIRDPLEPEYGMSKATIFSKGQRDGRVKILSRAHGNDVVYFLDKPASPEIVVSAGSLQHNVEAAIAALAMQNPPIVLQRGSSLVRVAHLPDAAEGRGYVLPKGTAHVVTVSGPDLELQLCRVAKWSMEKRDREGNPYFIPTDPPPKVAQVILASQGHWHEIPSLRAISETPIIRPNGSLLYSAGYDPLTQLYYEGNCPPLDVPEMPTKADALKGAETLRSVFSEFCFVDQELGWSVTLAYMLTLALRGQMPLAPMFAISATTPGSGKGLLLNVCNRIVRGRNPATMPPVAGNGAEEETRKRVTATLMQGITSANLDNWSVPIGGDSLNTLLTSDEWSDRVLGRSESCKLPNRLTLAATGNNLTVRGDMTRRTLLVEMNPAVERPELKSFSIKDLDEHVLIHRQSLLSALFTIIKAYIVAGRPEDDGRVLGSFGSWSRAVCAPIRWLGYKDPIETQDKLRASDPETTKLERLLSAIRAVFNGEWFVTGALEDPQFSTDEDGAALRDVLLEVTGDQYAINRRKLGWYLQRFSGRIVGGLLLERNDERKVPRYRVLEVT